MTDRPRKDFPILFSEPMVLALLAGSKTMTRRALYSVRKLKEGEGIPAKAAVLNGYPPVLRAQDFDIDTYHALTHWHKVRPKDRLWVRESWSHDSASLDEARAQFQDITTRGSGIYYRATEVSPDTLKWRSSIHIPRWASRLTITVTQTKIERVQDITDADCLAEGIVPFYAGRTAFYGVKVRDAYAYTGRTPREAFMNLWCAVNGPSAWALNPWVVALSGVVVPTNIDDLYGFRG